MSDFRADLLLVLLRLLLLLLHLASVRLLGPVGAVVLPLHDHECPSLMTRSRQRCSPPADP